ncbi:MAG: hypothetical protein NTW52_14670 [Planctomycetota bacterium]|nr:hypothetical protein [Planctomycetota bacterium]
MTPKASRANDLGETTLPPILSAIAKSAAAEEIADFALPIRKVTKLMPVDHYLHGSWEAIGAGAPVLVALAQLTSQAIIDQPDCDPEKLSGEAKAILIAARARGVIEIKGSHTAFEAPSRMLAVYIEVDDTRTIAFRDPERPEVTVRFLEGFRQLCAYGLVIHHTHRDFSLTQRGFDLAKSLSTKESKPWLDQGREFGLHD